MTATKVKATCPQCYHQGLYWLTGLEKGDSVCHICEAPLTLGDVLVEDT